MLFLVLPLCLLCFGLLGTACGGGGGGGGSAVAQQDAAVVGDAHITRTELDRRLQQGKCSYELQKREFPKAGSPEFQAVQQQVLQSLVQRAQLAQKAPEVGVTVTDKQVNDQLAKLKKQYFGGSEKRYQAEIKRQCITDAEVHSDLRSNLLSDAIYKKVTTDVKVTTAQAQAYYNTHKDTYTQPETRVVRHILVKDKKLADKLYAQLKGGADFAALAKKYSTDPGSKTQGGQLTISKGQTVPEFDKTAFALKTGELSKPVKTQYGWHIIRAEKAAVPSKVTPFSQVKESIRQQLLQQQRADALQKWLDGVKKEFATKIKYGSGLAPQTTSTAPATMTG
jgi:parvulin-like peptidyl-prolyl isomerase